MIYVALASSSPESSYFESSPAWNEDSSSEQIVFISSALAPKRSASAIREDTEALPERIMYSWDCISDLFTSAGKIFTLSILSVTMSPSNA